MQKEDTAITAERFIGWRSSRPFSLKDTLEESNVNTIHVPSD